MSDRTAEVGAGELGHGTTAALNGAGREVLGNGAGEPAVSVVTALGQALGIRDEEAPRGWFTRIARRYLARSYRQHKAAFRARGDAAQVMAEPAPKLARRAIAVACVKSAVSGALAGSVSTAATLLTAQTEGLLGFVAVPAAALTIGSEMVYRSVLHIDLTCELACIFGLDFDPTDPSHERDLWRLYALAFGTSDHRETESGSKEDPGKALLAEVGHLDGEEVGAKIGHVLVGESVMRNIVPFVGIVSSAVANVMLTRKVGNTIRRYMRYRRAFHDAFGQALDLLSEHRGLLIEGLWFVFTADGRLEPEETALLAGMLQRLPPIERAAVAARLTDDEHEWTERIAAEIPEPLRDAFVHALEVAATVDKEVSAPERKVLRRAARKLGREFDQRRIDAMIESFEERGVLSAARGSRKG